MAYLAPLTVPYHVQCLLHSRMGLAFAAAINIVLLDGMSVRFLGGRPAHYTRNTRLRKSSSGIGMMYPAQGRSMRTRAGSSPLLRSPIRRTRCPPSRPTDRSLRNILLETGPRRRLEWFGTKMRPLACLHEAGGGLRSCSSTVSRLADRPASIPTLPFYSLSSVARPACDENLSTVL